MLTCQDLSLVILYLKLINDFFFFCATDPRFIYSTMTSINMLEFRGTESTKTQLFATDDGIVSFDLDWIRGWLYWANQTGHIQRTSLTQVKTEAVPTPVPGSCFESSLVCLCCHNGTEKL